jgi:hypothetical protein
MMATMTAMMKTTTMVQTAIAGSWDDCNPGNDSNASALQLDVTQIHRHRNIRA